MLAAKAKTRQNNIFSPKLVKIKNCSDKTIKVTSVKC